MNEPFLTASEIGEYVFCPQAWHLRRRRATRSSAANAVLAEGLKAHRAVGRRTEGLVRAERRSVRLLWLVIVPLTIVVVLAVLIGWTTAQ